MTDLMLRYFREKQQKVQSENVYETQCPFCSMQCKMQLIEQKIISRKQYKTIGQDNPTSEGRLCVKGLYAHQHALNQERITKPLLKINGQFVPVSWQVALDTIQERFTSIQKKRWKECSLCLWECLYNQ